MAAVAYKVSMNVQTPDGQKSIFLTASDVNAAYWVFPSGGTEMQLSAGTAVIRDIILAPTYGTDTTNVSLFVNGIDTGFRLINAANQSGTYNRQVLTSPITIRPGALVKFVQNT